MMKYSKIKEGIMIFLITFLLSYSVSKYLKLVFKIPRPCKGLPNCPANYSFPSTHATVAFALATSFSFLIKRYRLLLFLAAALITAQRVYLGFHTLKDVAFGSLLGFAIGLVVMKIWKLFNYRINK